MNGVAAAVGPAVAAAVGPAVAAAVGPAVIASMQPFLKTLAMTHNRLTFLQVICYINFCNYPAYRRNVISFYCIVEHQRAIDGSTKCRG